MVTALVDPEVPGKVKGAVACCLVEWVNDRGKALITFEQKYFTLLSKTQLQ